LTIIDVEGIKMNKKTIVLSILAVLILITISLTTTVSSNTTDTEKKESPLYGIRVKQKITQRIGRIIENIDASFIRESRIFFVLPFYRFFQRNEDPAISVQLVPSFCPPKC
jgi:hypothetical protein